MLWYFAASFVGGLNSSFTPLQLMDMSANFRFCKSVLFIFPPENQRKIVKETQTCFPVSVRGVLVCHT